VVCCVWAVGAVFVDIILCYTILFGYYYVVFVYFSVLSYFITDCEICLIVLCCSVFVACCFSYVIFDTVVLGWWVVSLAVFGVFWICLRASRAF
jgi:hypothetical protein